MKLVALGVANFSMALARVSFTALSTRMVARDSEEDNCIANRRNIRTFSKSEYTATLDRVSIIVLVKTSEVVLTKEAELQPRSRAGLSTCHRLKKGLLGNVEMGPVCF
jgi:hypothetical protein